MCWRLLPRHGRCTFPHENMGSPDRAGVSPRASPSSSLSLLPFMMWYNRCRYADFATSPDHLTTTTRLAETVSETRLTLNFNPTELRSRDDNYLFYLLFIFICVATEGRRPCSRAGGGSAAIMGTTMDTDEVVGMATRTDVAGVGVPSPSNVSSLASRSSSSDGAASCASASSGSFAPCRTYTCAFASCCEPSPSLCADNRAAHAASSRFGTSFFCHSRCGRRGASCSCWLSSTASLPCA